MQKTYDFLKFLYEEIRMRYAPRSKFGVDNEALFELPKVKPSLNQMVSVTKSDINLYNPNILFLHPSLKNKAKRFYEQWRFNFVPPYTKSEHFLILAKEILELEYDEQEWKKNERPAFMNAKLFNAMKALRKKKLNLVVLGYGGAMINMLYNWSVYTKHLSVTYPFGSIEIYEPENIAYTNLLRIGKPIAYRDYYNEFVVLYKYKWSNERDYNPEKYKGLPKVATFDEEEILAKTIKLHTEYFDVEKMLSQYDLDNTIFIGAPDLQTRKALAEAGANFFMVGHHDNRVRITKCPVPEGGGLLQETYGTVEIPALLMNLQLASMKMIEILANDIEELKQIPNDTVLFLHDFDQYAVPQAEKTEGGHE